MRQNKFKVWDKEGLWWFSERTALLGDGTLMIDVADREWTEPADPERFDIVFFTGLLDKNGVEIYEGSILQFSDKWEWYRCTYGPKLLFADKDEKKRLMAEFEKEPYERRVISLPEDYEWLLSSEIQSEWEVIGNLYENPELLK